MAYKGIDVSVWQGNIDFNKVKAAGIDFVIIRAGYGKAAEMLSLPPAVVTSCPVRPASYAFPRGGREPL